MPAPPAGGLSLPGMTNDSTARLNLPYLVEGQAMKHLTINEALAALDGLVCAVVTSRTLAEQPESRRSAPPTCCRPAAPVRSGRCTPRAP